MIYLQLSEVNVRVGFSVLWKTGKVHLHFAPYQHVKKIKIKNRQLEGVYNFSLQVSFMSYKFFILL